MPNTNETPKFPDVYHPNAVDLHIDEVREQALASLGLNGREDLNAHQAAQVGQAMADRLEALQSNINQQSE